MNKLQRFLLLLSLISFLFVFMAFAHGISDSSSFVITSLTNNEWNYQGTLSYDYHFATKNIELNLGSQQQKEIKIRIKQIGDEIDAAHIDYLALKVGNYEIAPDEVIELNNQNNILHKISSLDNDVVDVTGHTIEATWRNINAGKVLLIMNAREEILKDLPGIPFNFPPNLNLNEQSTFVEYKLKNSGKIVTDGRINSDDNLDLPDFSFYTVPVTGHPPGYAYFYIKNDENYLYVVQDITSDNTLDADDWSKVYFYIESGLKEFTINFSNEEYGKSGFVYTNKVNYQHKLYEFKIPFEIAINNNNIKIGFRFYGTVGDAGGGAGSAAGTGEGEGSTSSSGTTGEDAPGSPTADATVQADGAAAAADSATSTDTSGNPCTCSTCPEILGSCPFPDEGKPCDSCGNTYQADGSCPPTDTSKVGLSCGSCGGTILSDCSCSKPNPLGYGDSCDNCGGTIGCDGNCNKLEPPRYGQACESCGGTINCNNLCSNPNPANYLQPCVNNAPSGTDSNCGDGNCADYSISVIDYCVDDETGSKFCVPTLRCFETEGGGTVCNPCSDAGCIYGPYYKRTNVTPYTENCQTCPQDCGQCPAKCNAFDCSGNCKFNELCSNPGVSECVGPKYKTCDLNFKCISYSGTDADKDGVDKECGDFSCDNAVVVTDATKTATEANCGDGLDNDCNGLTDCADTNCQSNPPCCTVTKRDCREYSIKQFERINKINVDEEQQKVIDNDLNEGNDIKEIRRKKLAKIVSNQFFACPPDDTDTNCCPDSSCVYNGACYADGEKKDVDGDGELETCVAHSPGQWVAGVEFDCTDNFDNDGDGLTDCKDPDCNGSINGTVKAQNNSQPIEGADVIAKKNITTVQTSTTDQKGFYKFLSLNCGPYNLVVSAANFAPRTQYTNLTPNTALTVNFNETNALALGTSCENDCTFVADNLIHASCDDSNGCSFFDATAKSVCDNAQPGWLRDYDANNYVVCASGPLQPKTQTQASVSCASGTLVKVTRIVLYNGKPVKLVVATCG